MNETEERVNGTEEQLDEPQESVNAVASEEAGVSSQRDRLLRSMVFALADKSYESVTIADVVEGAGVSRSTFYEQFENKDECLLAAYDALTGHVLGQVSDAFDAEESWPSGIRSGLQTFLDYFAAEPAIARMVLVEVPAAGPKPYARYRAAMERFLPFFERGREYLDDGVQLPQQSELMAVGAAEAIIFDEVVAGRTANLPEMLPDILFTVLVPYLGPENAAVEMHAAAPAA